MSDAQIGAGVINILKMMLFVQHTIRKNRDLVQKYDIKNRDLVQNTCVYQLFLLPLQRILKATGYET
jgi:hypothetical protein